MDEKMINRKKGEECVTAIKNAVKEGLSDNLTVEIEMPKEMAKRLLKAAEINGYKRKTDIGGFDERWGMAYEDVEFCLRAWQKGWKVYLTNKVRATHLEGATRGRNKEEKLAKNPMMWYKEEMAIKKTRKLLSKELVSSVEQKVALERRRL